jgi:hypothetical protein
MTGDAGPTQSYRLGAAAVAGMAKLDLRKTRFDAYISCARIG